MKFYSEELKTLFDSAEELEKAEAEHQAKVANKKQAINSVLDKFEGCIKTLNETMEEFAPISETLTPSETRKIIHDMVELMSSLNLPMFWKF